ncbi:MAG: permease-like cell division protein FtsX [Flavobacteriia bacterium]|nr:permease-like cell division protein FtsX [Flavobacteriia bacterium]
MSTAIEKYNKRGIKTSYISTIIGISLVLFMIGIVLSGMFGLSNIQNQAKENLQGDIFFDPKLNDADIKQIELRIKSWAEFKKVWFVSSERAIKEFGGKDQAEITELLEGENPLPPSLCFSPNAEFANKSGMKQIKTKLLKQFSKEIDEVNYDESSVEKVNLGFQQFVMLFLSMAALLIIIAVAMINNTIRMSLFSKRYNIKTMTLVGATGRHIRLPYLKMAVFQGLISAIVALSLLTTVFFALNNVLETIEVSFSWQVLLLLVGSLILIGIFITVISTWFALNKYLRMKLDDLY